MVDLLKALRSRFDERRRDAAALDTTSATWYWRTAREIAEHQIGERKVPPDLAKLDKVLEDVGQTEKAFADAVECWIAVFRSRQLALEVDATIAKRKQALNVVTQLREERKKFLSEFTGRYERAVRDHGHLHRLFLDLERRLRIDGEGDLFERNLGVIATQAPDVVRDYRRKVAGDGKAK